MLTGFNEHLQIVTTSNYSAIVKNTLCSSLQHALSLLSLLHLHRLPPRNGFQSRSFLSFHVHVLTGRWLSHKKLTHINLLIFLLPSQDSFATAAAPRYTASAQTAQKTPPQWFYCCITQLSHGPHREHRYPLTPLLHVTNLLLSLAINICCLQSHYLVTAVV
jgi:hypothetical protein